MTPTTEPGLVERLRYCSEYGVFSAGMAGMLAPYSEAADTITELVEALKLADDFLCELAGETPLMDFVAANFEAGELLLTVRAALKAVQQP